MVAPIEFYPELPEKNLNEFSAIVIDKKVKQLYYPALSLPHFEILAEEKHKSVETLQNLWNFFYEHKLDRHSLLGIVGGGLTLDVAGFAASTWMRGIPCVLFPTTLLAQADASIGGKTAVNFKNIKNLLGSFYAPQKIIIATHFLYSLEKKQIRSGFAEMLKHALITSPNLFEDFLQLPSENLENLLPFLPETAEIKRQIVLQDPYEKSIRKYLNFGHTFGHAIERLETIEHGEAVALGMLIASAFSVKLLHFPYEKYLRLAELLKNWNFPVHLLENFSWQSMETFLLRDKKKKNNKIRFVFLEEIGAPVLMEASL